MDKKVTKELNIEKLKKEIENINIERDIQNIIKKNSAKQEVNLYTSYYPKKPKKNLQILKKDKKESKEIKNENVYKKTSEDNKKRIELIQELEYLRKNYINKFLEESKKRTDIEAENTIAVEGKEFQKKVELVIKKAEEELNSYTQKIESIELKNKELITNINIIKSHKKILQTQLKDAEIAINKINKKFEIFNDLKPYYEELLKEFNIEKDNYKSKDKILSNDMKKRRKEASEFNEEIEERRETIKKLMEKKRNEDFDNRKMNEEMSSDLREIELKNRSIEDDYNIKFMKIKQDIDSLYEYKEENIKIRNALVTIHNLFFPKLNLERDLNIHPKGIDLIKTDYTPKIYETDEIVKYIYLMLKNSNEETTGLLLREIVSYCNMMLRNTIKGYEKTYYEPLSTVKQIEALITSKENQNEELKNTINSYTETNDKNQAKINKLELEIKRIEKMHEILHNKMREFYKKNKIDFNDTASKASIDDSDKNKKNKRSKYKLPTEYNLISPINKEKKGINIFRTKTEVFKEKSQDKSKYINKNVKIDFSQGVQQLVDHANRLFFYQAHLNLKPKETGVYIKAQKRMNQKFKRLKKLEQNNNKFSTVEKAVVNTVNNHIDNLLTELNGLSH